MKRFISLSLALHLAALFYVAGMEPKPLQDKIEIEVTEGNKQTGKDVQVIENVQDEVDATPKEKTSYYYGIGVSGYYSQGVYHIEKVYSGYSAESALLKPGDVVILVNGVSPMLEDISGDSPKELWLTILRNGQQILIKTRRVKVYY